MTTDTTTRHRRALYRAQHRGTKELDWLLGRYAEAHLAAMAEPELATFERMLALRKADVDLKHRMITLPTTKANKAMFKLSVSPEDAPDKATVITIGFEKGDAVSINGEAMSPATLLTALNQYGHDNGVGRLDLGADHGDDPGVAGQAPGGLGPQVREGKVPAAVPIEAPGLHGDEVRLGEHLVQVRLLARLPAEGEGVAELRALELAVLGVVVGDELDERVVVMRRAGAELAGEERIVHRELERARESGFGRRAGRCGSV